MSVKQIEERALYNVEEVSDILGIRRETARKLFATGRIKGTKMARKWFVTGKNLKAVFDEPQKQTTASRK